MPRPIKRYAFYDSRGYVMDGTKQEIADKMGISISTINYYCSPAYRYRSEGWETAIRVYPLQEEGHYLDHVDVEKIKRLCAERGYRHKDIADWLGVAANTVSVRMNYKTRFTLEQVQIIEDMFFLDRGELIMNKEGME